MPNLPNGTKGDSNPGSHDYESGILPLSYRAPQMCGLRSDGCESCRRLPIEATEKRLALPGTSELNSGDS